MIATARPPPARRSTCSREDVKWAKYGNNLDRLAAAIEALWADLDTDYNKFTPMIPQADYVRDWLPPVPNSTSLRLHFTSRAKPREDPRNIMVQHVAVGTWYYKARPCAWVRTLS